LKEDVILGDLFGKGMALVVGLLALTGGVLSACGSDDAPGKVLYVGGIPDQESASLVRRFDGVADYLSQELGVRVEYRSSVDYVAVVNAFKQGDIDLAWFGGFTGVQARRLAPGAQAIAQRPRDADFHSVFVVQAGLPARGLGDLKGLTFTFGSPNSTSGHLMPRNFLLQEGVAADDDFDGLPNFSSSHHTTWKLVESGAFQAGVLNEAVWAQAVEEGRVDLSKIRVLETTPAYFDYNWTLRPDVDRRFGEGFTDRVRDAFMSMGDGQRELLALFQTEGFIETDNDNYKAIEEVAEMLGFLQ
jgi:phosphonate transport system substrate-binding protein